MSIIIRKGGESIIELNDSDISIEDINDYCNDYPENDATFTIEIGSKLKTQVSNALTATQALHCLVALLEYETSNSGQQVESSQTESTGKVPSNLKRILYMVFFALGIFGIVQSIVTNFNKWINHNFIYLIIYVALGVFLAWAFYYQYKNKPAKS